MGSQGVGSLIYFGHDECYLCNIYIYFYFTRVKNEKDLSELKGFLWIYPRHTGTIQVTIQVCTYRYIQA